MSEKALAELYKCFDASIESMDDEFTAHQFILHLAKHNQREYISALCEVRGDAPFQTVHGAIANRLNHHGRQVEQLTRVADSPNIFGEKMSCSRWRKIS